MKTIQQARLAAKTLATLNLQKRTELLLSLKMVILSDREAIIDVIQKETGKSRTDALVSEIFPVLDHLEFLIKKAPKILKDKKVHTPIALMGKSSWIYFEPVGVVLVISPWNYPFYQAVVPCSTSFVTGNATVYKPSEHTPLKGLFEKLLKKAGFEESWIQVVYGDGKQGSELIEQRPDKIFFTGSVQTGKKIMSLASNHLIPVELELGGKDPMIVFEDVDIERASSGAAWGALTNTGQSCTSVELLFVQESIYEPFKKALLAKVGRVKQEIDSDGNADIGKITTLFQVDTIRKQVEQARNQGAKFLSGGHWDGQNPLVPPMIVESVTPDMQIYSNETFGPLIPLIPFKTEQEVIEKLNSSEFGLSASIWSADLNRATRVARALHTGNVSINNVMLTEGNPALPFGGIKNSGFGRYKGEFGLYAFSNIKSILIDKNSKKIEANWYPYTKTKYQLFTQMMLGLFSGGLLNLIKFIVFGLKLENYSNKTAKKPTEHLT